MVFKRKIVQLNVKSLCIELRVCIYEENNQHLTMKTDISDRFIDVYRIKKRQ